MEEGMHRVVLRHGSGSKNQQVEEFPLDQAKDLIIGRDPTAQVKFDAIRDDLVGKQHARILQDPANRFRFSIVDMNSRNGTYVNQRRVQGTMTLNPGDMIQLGPGGPEFQFEIDPLPTTMVPPTRETASGGLTKTAAPVPPTREAMASGAVTSDAITVKAGIGPQTLEYRLGEARREHRQTLMRALAVVAVVALAVAGGVAWQWQNRGTVIVEPNRTRDEAWDATKTAAEFGQSTVFVEFAWKLVFRTGEQVYHHYEHYGKEKNAIPVFERLSSPDRIVPVLALRQGSQQHNQPIGCTGTGSGFVVTTDGFIMTNRHVAASWNTRYMCFPDSGPALLKESGDKPLRYVKDISSLNLDWVPAQDGREVSGKRFEGQNVYLEVLFKLNSLRFPATVARVSDRADVSLIKINSPQPVKKVNTLDSYESIAVGNNIIVIGYPAVSPDVTVWTQSVDPLSRQGRATVIPDPTVTPGNIGRIHRATMRRNQGTMFDYQSDFGDGYQLTINTTGAGNSGGPVFDDHGHVIGLFTYSTHDRQGTQVTFAVPIRYGLELMGTSPAVAGTGGQ
jgi:S1-C subfamily serine protease